MRMFDTMINEVKQGGKRRGAMIGILNYNHPEILDFIKCKTNGKQLTNFNISVLVDGDFMLKVAVDGHKISVKADNAHTVQFIADGKVICKGEIGSNGVYLDLDRIKGAEDFQYVRVEVFGEGGICLTQALVIDNEPTEEFEEDKGILACLNKIAFILKSTRLWTIIVELYRIVF